MRLSIIIVTFNNENYIEQAIRSCFDAGVVEELEVIVVDNASLDRTQQIVERVQKGQPDRRLEYVRLDQNIGPGLARNVGVERFTGDYLLFLDGDDFFITGSLTDIVSAIHETNYDIILFNHVRYDDTGELKPNIKSKMLMERDASEPSSRGPLMENFSVAWNKAYKRSFLERINLKFNDGIYEDVSWSFRAQMEAESLYVMSTPVVAYRQRSGSITKSKGTQHFNIFNEYEIVFDILEKNTDLSRHYGPFVYTYARRQIFHIAHSQFRLSRAQRSRFGQRALLLLRRWRTALQITEFDLYISVASSAGMGATRQLSDAYNTYRQAKRLLRVSIIRPALVSFRWLKSILNLYLFRASSRLLKIRPRKAMFESYWGLKADCNPLAIAKLLSAHSDFDIVWNFKNKDAVPPNFPFRWVERGSLRMVLEAASTRFFISNTNIPDEIEKRKGSVHLQTWHGTPVKVMGLDIRPYNPDELNWEKFAKRSRRSDYVLSSNPHSSYVWRRASPYNYKMLETGYPRNDQLVRHTQLDIERIRKLLRIPDGFKVALYAPTIRDEAKGGVTPIPPRLFNFEKVLAALGDQFVLITRAHYFSKIDQRMIDRLIDVSSHPYSNDACLVSDILITDYSSIMFDYCALDRPIIIYAYDYEDYARKRGVYFDITQDSPGPVARSQNELIEILQTRAYEGPESRAKLESFRERFALWDDGYAAHRVVKTVFGVDIPECSGGVTSDE